MNRKYINRLKTGLLLLTTLLVAYSCSEEWDKHYDADPAVVTDKTLWDNINSNPELSDFAAILKQAGYDKALSESQTYTVWAPVNGAFDCSNMDEEAIIKEFINNHIARKSITASGEMLKNITMLNGKVINFENASGASAFDDIVIKSPNILALNGILHIITSKAAYFSNIWEYLSKDVRLDSISKYIHSFDTLVFVPALSIQGDIVNGEIVYLDSAFINANALLSRLGYLNAEDSTYTMIVPSNTAWIEAYNRVKNYFVYSNRVTNRESYQNNYTKSAIINDLCFNNNLQESPADSLITTTRHTFYQPQYLFDGAEKIEASNGKIYITDLLKYKAEDSWHRQLLIEAEDPTEREQTLCNIYSRSAYESTISGISGGRYIEVIPTGANSNPTIQFPIKQNLSAKYNIYCVFAPATVANPNAQNLKPCKVNFTLNYPNSSGISTTNNFGNATFVTNPEKLDTVLVGSNFAFPVANYGLEGISNVTFKVICNVGRTETTTYTRNMLIDCLILEPVH
ncbi:fasciclin domain-containing protein [Viscerimonas tarda]